jgi:hypothetical protein
MIDGKPATPDQINLFKKMHGVGQQDPVNPELLNIQAKIKKGDATPEDFARMQQVELVDGLRTRFDSQAEHDRNTAVRDIISVIPRYAQTPEAQEMFFRELGISKDEVAAAQQNLRSGGGGLPRGSRNKDAQATGPWSVNFNQVRPGLGG